MTGPLLYCSFLPSLYQTLCLLFWGGFVKIDRFVLLLLPTIIHDLLSGSSSLNQPSFIAEFLKQAAMLLSCSTTVLVTLSHLLFAEGTCILLPFHLPPFFPLLQAKFTNRFKDKSLIQPSYRTISTTSSRSTYTYTNRDINNPNINRRPDILLPFSDS